MLKEKEVAQQNLALKIENNIKETGMVLKREKVGTKIRITVKYS